MNKKLCNLVGAFALALTTSGLGASVASAQTVQRINIERPTLRANDFIDIRSTSTRTIAPREDRAWPAAAAAVAGAVYAVVEIVHRVTERWMPTDVNLSQRGNLVSLGVYDR